LTGIYGTGIKPVKSVAGEERLTWPQIIVEYWPVRW
jgi:hypothetical protein